MEQIKTLPALSFVQAFDAAFKKIFQFNGRAHRSEYWWPVAVVFLVSLFKPLIGGILSLLQFLLLFVGCTILGVVAGGGAEVCCCNWPFLFLGDMIL